MTRMLPDPTFYASWQPDNYWLMQYNQNVGRGRLRQIQMVAPLIRARLRQVTEAWAEGTTNSDDGNPQFEAATDL